MIMTKELKEFLSFRMVMTILVLLAINQLAQNEFVSILVQWYLVIALADIFILKGTAKEIHHIAFILFTAVTGTAFYFLTVFMNLY